MDLGLRDRVAIVGGSSRGIGRATAKLLAIEGCRVVMAARARPALEDAADMLRQSLQNKTGTRPQMLAVQCDMASEADIRRLVASTVGEFGAIDIVVNNAGGPPLGGFEQHDDAAWQHAFETNFMSVTRVVREALPHLKASGQGRVINITSTAVREPIDGLILSNSVRLGTTGLAKSLSRELGQYGITVTTSGLARR
jgi:3-oxoacyl-[acyl-carrier protein] reductase